VSRAEGGGGHFDHLGKSLLMLRVLKGLSQAETAARAGIRPNQISRYETGQVLPQLEQLGRLLEALDVDEVDFVLFHARVRDLVAGMQLAAEAGAAGREEVVEVLRELAAKEVRSAGRVREVLAALVE
jgi:transcriptional regulator with XRE-family HTH domain